MGTPKDMLSKALEMGICFHRDSSLGNMGGHSFPRAFDRSVNFFIKRTSVEEFERHVKESSGNGQLSLYWPSLGNLQGVHLPKLLTDR